MTLYHSRTLPTWKLMTKESLVNCFSQTTKVGITIGFVIFEIWEFLINVSFLHFCIVSTCYLSFRISADPIHFNHFHSAVHHYISFTCLLPDQFHSTLTTIFIISSRDILPFVKRSVYGPLRFKTRFANYNRRPDSEWRMSDYWN